jgi:GMP synthase (glutamine-hydrolysing)
MKIHIIQHVEYENPGFIEDWIIEKKHSVSYTKFYKDSELPKLDEFNWLIVLGGPMGVYDEKKFPWLSKEKTFIKQAIENDKIVLGICLGAQLIASSFGWRVYPNLYKEIGWFKITMTVESKYNNLFNFFPEELVVFHWHGDTFELPKGLTNIAQSEACKNQAFVYKEKVIGLQFHLEVTPQSLQNMITNGEDELVEDKYIHTEEQILNGKRYCRQNNNLLRNLLDKIANNFGEEK